MDYPGQYISKSAIVGERKITHTCHAIGCTVEVPPEYFMCLRHWQMTPAFLREEVSNAYRPGQCDDWSMVSKRYCIAAKNALVAVAHKEKRIVNFEEEELMLYDVFIRGSN